LARRLLQADPLDVRWQYAFHPGAPLARVIRKLLQRVLDLSDALVDALQFRSHSVVGTATSIGCQI
jgi:hypothetical protein